MRESGSTEAHCRFLQRLRNFIFDTEDESGLLVFCLTAWMLKKKKPSLIWNIQTKKYIHFVHAVPVNQNKKTVVSLKYRAFRGRLFKLHKSCWWETFNGNWLMSGFKKKKNIPWLLNSEWQLFSGHRRKIIEFLFGSPATDGAYWELCQMRNS